ncbi:MAG TPA: NUDIX hydrolase [Thermoanaerobaculia bacterium]|nr:NUDIX hydrolase [Thermoanaerobaculia bacterium]
MTNPERPRSRGRRRRGGKPKRAPGKGGRRSSASQPTPQNTEHHRSAGGLIVHGSQILLISVMEGKRWQLPKGHIEEGETPAETAVREVREETGVTGRVRAPLPGVEYWFVDRGRKRVHKTVDYFLLDFVSGDPADYDRREVSGAEWMSWDEGIARLTFENERRAVRVARELVDPVPPLPQGVE